MTLALKVTDSNCTIWPMASIKELQNLVGFFFFFFNLFWGILKWIFFFPLEESFVPATEKVVQKKSLSPDRARGNYSFFFFDS